MSEELRLIIGVLTVVFLTVALVLELDMWRTGRR